MVHTFLNGQHITESSALPRWLALSTPPCSAHHRMVRTNFAVHNKPNFNVVPIDQTANPSHNEPRGKSRWMWDGQGHRQLDGQADSQMDLQADWQAVRPADRQVVPPAERRQVRPADRSGHRAV